MRTPEFSSEGLHLLATLHCPHGHRFAVYDRCPAVKSAEQIVADDGLREPGWFARWRIARRARRLSPEDFMR